jgi:cellulose synthase/poly-beta-1,6-N-acetylglucosamine synthase-like glycosyltransferase
MPIYSSFFKIQSGFRYGSLVEDYYTGYRLHCEGWKSVLCDPPEPAFLGEAPKSLNDTLNQCKRWMVGLYQVMLSEALIIF